MGQLTEHQASGPESHHVQDLNAFHDALMRWTDVRARVEPIYKRGHETRAQLISAARRAFIRLGYIDCSVEDILQEANISRGTFYSHFRSKKAIFGAATMEHIRERVTRTEVWDASETDYRARVRLTIERYLQNYADTHDFSLVIEQAANYDPGFREVRLVIRDIFARRIERGIRRQQAEGRVDQSLHSHRSALMILSMLTNMAQVEIAWRGQQPSPAMVEDMTDFWCKGIGLS